MKRTKISELLTGEALGKEVKVSGWVRTFRNDMFIALNDGSSVKNLQCVINQENHPASDIKRLYAGTCISAEGVLKESQGKGQDYELLVGRLEILGEANPDEYPLQPKAHSLEFLREIAHLRPRTNLFGAVMRVRSTAAQAIHRYFASKGFFYFNAPIITGSDCEGAGEMFGVSVLPHEGAPKCESGAVDFFKGLFRPPDQPDVFRTTRG